jgi:glycosyltransferase involved in cell wall biosynthesis
MKNPKISLIIATRDRIELLDKTLYSLTLQSYKDKYEVIVCDDGGTKNTKSFVEKYSSDLDIKYFWCEDQGGYCWAHAKNFGAKKARAEYLLFMDDDILLPHNGIEKMYKWIIRTPWRRNRYYVTPTKRLYVKSYISKSIISNLVITFSDYTF